MEQMGGIIKLKHSRLLLFHYPYCLLKAQSGGHTDSQSEAGAVLLQHNSLKVYRQAELSIHTSKSLSLISVGYIILKVHFNAGVYLIDGGI